MSQYAVAPRRMNGPGLASVIVGAVGVLAAVPIVVVIVVLVAVVWGGLELDDSAQFDVFVGLLSWFVAAPLAGLLGLGGTITAIVGLFRRPRTLAGIGIALSLVALLSAVAAITLAFLFSATLQSFEPLLGTGT
ncbi:hypothetical protein NY547_10305 [Cnuibacter physcomitrellae]|uniref:hypothetical protein n=1 Tax=Cnuibacter physcomitrellae TaxID=1619308 RepID=UPI002175A9B6|nr:hypothetical protein [Cnuibacter physcomitrellae]MCS5497628.1 hypothetical protein [Cnuibacter physcomitrellae]